MQCLRAAVEGVAGIDVFAAASSAHAADVSFGVMDLNVSCCMLQLGCSNFNLNHNAVLFLIVWQDLASVASFASAYDQPAIDVLICNAGIMNTPFALSKVRSVYMLP